MTIRPARAIAAGTTSVAVAAALALTGALPASAAETTAAVDDRVVIDANHVATVDVLANDTAPEGVRVELLDPAGNPVTSFSNLYGQWSIAGSVVTHTPPDGRAGPRTATYRITDADGDSSTATITVQVNTINRPVLMSEQVSTPIGVPITIDVLANDWSGSNRDGVRFPLQPDTLRVRDAAGAFVTSYTDASGTVEVVDGRVVYTPAEGWWGNTRVTYRVADSVRQTATSTASVSVTPVPIANDDVARGVPGEAVRVPVLANDTTPEGTTLGVWGLSERPGLRVNRIVQPGVGVWTMDGDHAVFTPEAGFIGTATAEYQLHNSRYQIDRATITVTIAEPQPAVLAADAVTTPYFTATDVDVLANDVAPEGATIDADSLRLVDAAGALVTELETQRGTWTVVDGRLHLQPKQGAYGTDTVTYSVATSQGVRATSTVRGTVSTPRVSTMGELLEHEFSAAAPSLTIDVLANDSSEGNSSIDVSTLAMMDHNGNPVQSRTTAEGTWEIVDGQVRFTPARGFEGLAANSYTVRNDAGFRGSAVVAVEVTWAAEPPVLTADTATTPYSTATDVDVLANDSAPEGAQLDPASLRLVDASGALVTELETQRGTWTVVDGRLHLEPKQGAYGTDRITYSVATTEGATATSTVRATIQTPRVSSRGEIIEAAFGEGKESILIDVLANDTTEGNSTIDPSTLALLDHDGRAVPSRTTAQGTWEIVDGQVRFTPADGFEGLATNWYTVQNDAGFRGNAVVAVEVTQAAVAAEDDAVSIPRRGTVSVDVLANDTAKGGELDPSTLRLIGPDGQPTDRVTVFGGTFTVVDGEIVFEAHPRGKGPQTVEYVVGNGLASDTATLTVIVRQHATGGVEAV